LVYRLIDIPILNDLGSLVAPSAHIIAPAY